MEAQKRAWLIRARKAKALSQEAVANRVGLARTTYMRYEHGERTPSPAIASNLARILNVPREKFFWE